MFRRSHESAFDRVIVQVLQLLFHHGIVRNRLRMAPFLPNLMGARPLVCGAKYRS